MHTRQGNDAHSCYHDQISGPSALLRLPFCSYSARKRVQSLTYLSAAQVPHDLGMAESSSQDREDEEDAFHYNSLIGKPPHTIRLLTVHLGKSDLISCTLNNVYLDAEHRFKALSYMWGTEPPNRLILIGGKSFKIRPNLFDFLLRFRRSCQEPTCIWIDAICVNQNDIPKRTSQVRLMSTIYSQAELVIAWLGIQEPPGSLEALSRNPELVQQRMGTFREYPPRSTLG